MSKEGFKTFIRDNPGLANYVKNNEMSWQKFYEMYDLYGSNHEIWQSYLKTNTNSSSGNITLKDIIAMAKGFDLGAVQKGLSSLERAVGVIRDVTVKNVASDDLTRTTNNYEPRPMYKYFED